MILAPVRQALRLMRADVRARNSPNASAHSMHRRHVVRLNVARAVLTTAECRQIARLETLKSLNLSHSQISREGLTELIRCPSLEQLDISGTSLTAADVCLLVNLPNLRSLVLPNVVDVDSLSCLGRFQTLESLDLSGATVSLDDLRLLTRVPKILVLSWYVIGSGIARFKSLLASRPWKNCAFRAYLGTRRVVELAGAKNLRRVMFAFRHTTVVSNRGMVALSMGTQTPRTGACFISVPADELLSEANLTGLERLSLKSCRLTEGRAAFVKAMPDLATVDFSDTDLTDEGLRDLESLGRLTRLSLFNTNVTSVGMLRSKLIGTLETLDMRQTATGDRVSERIASAPRLRSFLASSATTDRGIATIAGSRSIRHLNVLYRSRTVTP